MIKREDNYVEELIKQEYEKWEPGDNVMILAGTGKGKSHFVKTVLNKHCRNTKRRVLLLTNRNILKEQIRKELGLNTIITVANYQQIESMILNKKNLNKYNYIVMDEAHYFFTDASFNIKTDIFFEWMLNNESACKVFMTATPFVLNQYFKLHNIKVKYKYELPTDYSYLSNIYMFDNYKTIEGIIESIPDDEQILFISRSAKRAYEISKKFKGAFICSKANDDFKKYIDEEELDNIIKKSMFQNHVLCATTVLDNGINIKEFTKVKHVIIDIFDRDTFIQCLGRKRVGQGETITLYFKNYDRKQVNGFKSRLTHGLELADTLIELGEEQYIKRSFKKDMFYKFNSKIIDDKWNDDKGASEKVINKCMYYKYQHDLGICNAILSKSSNKVTFKDIIARELGLDSDRIVDMEITEEKLTLEDYLVSIKGKKLFKEEQKELKQIFERHGLKARTLGINTLNGYMKDNKIHFIIEPDREHSTLSANYRKTYWKIGSIDF